jgi:hypothetical protein
VIAMIAQHLQCDALAALVTPDAVQLVADCREALARLIPGKDDAAIARYAARIGKDMLRLRMTTPCGSGTHSVIR